MQNKNITIIGGHGQMGKLFHQLWQDQGHTVYPIGRAEFDNCDDKLAVSDLVVICVPIKDTCDIIKKIAPRLKKNTVLADFTSLKSDPLMTMLAQHSGAVLGLHPMFGPTIHSPHNQIIVHCEGRNPSSCQWVIDSLSKIGFTLKAMNASKHDQAMNFIQGIEHFLTFSLGTFLHQKNEHPKELLEIASPIYLAKLLLMGRIFDQDPALYADIIMADKKRIELIKEFSLWLTDWVTKLENYDKTQFIDEFKNASLWMGEFTAYAQKVSDDFLTIDLD